MRRARLQLTVERLEACEHAAHSQDRVPPFRRPAAVRRLPFHDDVDPGESLVGHCHGHVGRLGHDRRVGAPALDERFRAQAGVLLVGHRRDNQSPGGQSTSGQNPGGADHRRDSALHVLSTAAVQPALAFDRIERRRHAGHADRVQVTAEHQRPPGRPSVEHAHDIGPAGGGVGHLDLQAGGTQGLGDGARHLALTGRPGHERRIHRIDRHQVAQQFKRRVAHRAAR